MKSWIFVVTCQCLTKEFLYCFVKTLCVCLENKAYGAVLVYHYSEEMDQFARTRIKNCITRIETMLKAFDFSVYDERRDFNIHNRE